MSSILLSGEASVGEAAGTLQGGENLEYCSCTGSINMPEDGYRGTETWTWTCRTTGGIGGSKGGHQECVPPLSPISFIFMQVLVKTC